MCFAVEDLSTDYIQGKQKVFWRFTERTAESVNELLAYPVYVSTLLKDNTGWLSHFDTLGVDV
jgi:hypothetical protein